MIFELSFSISFLRANRFNKFSSTQGADYPGLPDFSASLCPDFSENWGRQAHKIISERDSIKSVCIL